MNLSLFFPPDSRSFTLEGPPIDLAIPMQFSGPQPNTYGVPRATGEAYEGGEFIGDVRRGGSCNFETYTLTPHCNGTHTECVGHITSERISIHEVLKESFFPATLISVEAVSSEQTPDSYRPAANPEDRMITRASLEAVLSTAEPAWMNALIIRTRPNDPGKCSRDYLAQPPAFFSLEAMAYIYEFGVTHLLTDLPSVDRMFDEGHMDNHHIFWSVPKDTSVAKEESGRQRTITEMVYVPDKVQDGRYVVEIQVAAWMSDAAPSRPRIWGVRV